MKRLSVILAILAMALSLAMPALAGTAYPLGKDDSYPHTDYTFYDAFDATVTANYVYDEDGGVANGSGKFRVAFYPRKTITVNLETLESTSIAVKIEGGEKKGTSIQWTIIFMKTYSATGSEDIPIYSTKRFLRVGLIVVSDVAGDSITIGGSFGR